MKNYLAIEHLARFEQRRQLKKGYFVSLFNTPCVQNLPNKEKKQFFSYLKRKKRAPKLFIGVLALLLLGAFIFSSKLTGLTTLENQSNSLIIPLIFILAIVIIIAAFLITFKRNNLLSDRFNNSIEIAEKRLH